MIANNTAFPTREKILTTYFNTFPAFLFISCFIGFTKLMNYGNE